MKRLKGAKRWCCLDKTVKSFVEAGSYSPSSVSSKFGEYCSEFPVTFNDLKHICIL